MNSLLEEDLDFERAGKPVPVITAEVSESIEELIKRRILAHDFQDIIRRRPDGLATGKDGRRGKLDFELDDSKSKKGLAEEYEEEHLRRTDPNFVDVKDEKLEKEQKEIELQLIAAESRATLEYAQEIKVYIDEESKNRADRRERGKETVGDTLKRVWGWQ